MHRLQLAYRIIGASSLTHVLYPEVPDDGGISYLLEVRQLAWSRKVLTPKPYNGMLANLKLHVDHMELTTAVEMLGAH
jgi:hypothetical protein